MESLNTTGYGRGGIAFSVCVCADPNLVGILFGFMAKDEDFPYPQKGLASDFSPIAGSSVPLSLNFEPNADTYAKFEIIERISCRSLLVSWLKYSSEELLIEYDRTC